MAADISAIEKDRIASFHYKLADNKTDEILDESREPMEFLAGRDNIIPGLEKELIGMNAGDTKDIVVEPKEAYGEYDESATEKVPIDQFSGLELKEGMTIYAHDDAQQTRPVIVKSFDDKEVTIDYNHPLAGKTLKFSVVIAGIREASAGELESGFPQRPESGGCCGGGHDDSHDDGGCCGGGNGGGGGGCGCS